MIGRKLARIVVPHLRFAVQSMNHHHAKIIRVIRPQLPSAPAVWFPEDEMEESQSTFPCEAGNSGEQYADAYRPLNVNPVTIGKDVNGNSVPVQLALENRRRSEIIIVNVGTSSILIAFGFVPTLTNYTLPCAACAVANDGSGGIITDKAWKGQVWGILAAAAPANGSLLFTELVDENV